MFYGIASGKLQVVRVSCEHAANCSHDMQTTLCSLQAAFCAQYVQVHDLQRQVLSDRGKAGRSDEI